MPAPDRHLTGTTPPDRARLAGAAAVAAAVVLIAILSAGCLPSGTRGSAANQGPAGAAASVVAAPSVPGSPTPRPTIVPPTPTPAPTFLVYAVKSGDSLNSIAHRFGTTARSIAFWNRSTYPSLDPDSATYRPGLLKLGWTLILIPNDVVDEDQLPGPSTDPDVDPDASDPADESAAPA